MGLSHFNPAFPHVFHTLSPKMTPNGGRTLCFTGGALG